jgi:hypothetical protein
VLGLLRNDTRLMRVDVEHRVFTPAHRTEALLWLRA